MMQNDIVKILTKDIKTSFDLIELNIVNYPSASGFIQRIRNKNQASYACACQASI